MQTIVVLLILSVSGSAFGPQVEARKMPDLETCRQKAAELGGKGGPFSIGDLDLIKRGDCLSVVDYSNALKVR